MPSETSVLVVGAGPVGLTAALLLGRLGIPSRVVERRAGLHRAPQAHVINPRSLEICRALGVDMAALREQATPAADGAQVLWMTELAGREIGRLGFERQLPDMLASTPTPLLNLPQNRFEPILCDRLVQEAGAELRFRQQWESAVADEHGVRSQIRDLETDSLHELHSRWLIAADGASSRVRDSLAISMQGPERLQSFVMIHFEANLRALVRERPGILYWIVDPESPGIFIAHDIDRTWVYMHPFDIDRESLVDDYPETRCREILERAIGSADFPLEICDVGSWVMTAQVAASYRRGRILLAGDAAHRFPPTGGIGMNTGIQDVHNLVWKLAAVEAGWASVELLDSYEGERRPVAQTNCDQSLRNALKLLEVPRALGLETGSGLDRAGLAARLDDAGLQSQVAEVIENQREHFDMLGLHLGFQYAKGALVPETSPAPPLRSDRYEPSTRPGSRLPHAWLSVDGRRCSSLDLVAYDGFTLITGEQGKAWVEAAASIPKIPLRCRTLGQDFLDPDGRWAALSEISAEGALLLRPDQHVAWRARSLCPDPLRSLEAALQAILNR